MVANGLAVEHMKHAEQYIHEVFMSVSREFPSEFKYLGCRRCTYQEEYRETIRKRSVKAVYDIAESNFYMMRYEFSFRGEKLKPKYIYLPYVTENCTIKISNGRYLVSPVLADRVISIGVNYIFIRLLRDRMTFERLNHHMQINDQRETVPIVWSNVYHKTEAMRKLRNPLKVKCALAHYLFCKYGFTEAVQRFGNTTPIIGDHTTIDRHTYPEDKWVIIKSNMTRPKHASVGPWTAPTLRVAIPREDFTPAVKNIVAGLFYVVDHFPEYFTQPENVNNRRWMMILLGQIIFAPSIPHGRLANDIETHISSLDDYIDSIMIDKFKEIDRPITDLYQLFAMLIENFNQWLQEGSDKVNSMYDKELNVIGFLLETLTFLIVRLNFRLKAAAKKELKLRDVENALQAVKQGALFSLVKTSGCLSTTSSPGDNKAFKLTTILIPQTASQKGVGGKDRGMIGDKTKYLHESVAEVGGYSNIPKSEPSGRGRLNPHVRLSEKSLVLRHEDLRPMMDRVGGQIKRQ
jgi:hypothetical protein